MSFFSTHTPQPPPFIFHQLWTFSLLLRISFNIFYMFNLRFYDHLLSPYSANKCKAWGGHNRNSSGEILRVQRSINPSPELTPEVLSYISRRCCLMTKKSSGYWGIAQNTLLLCLRGLCTPRIPVYQSPGSLLSPFPCQIPVNYGNPHLRPWNKSWGIN